jgi:hypothetical protein
MKQFTVLTMLAPLLIIATIVLQTAGALADDSTARFGAGELTFTKSEEIRMLEEVLDISTKLIRVKFRFLNESDKDIHTTVAFPVPPYAPFWVDSRSGISNAARVMATFKVWVNGHLVQKEVDTKAVIGDRDITAQLRELGLSDEQIFQGVDLTRDQQAALKKLNEEKRALLQSKWKVAETAFWQQTFPAGKEVVVEHSYRPAVGYLYSAPYQKGFGYVHDLPSAQREGKTDNVCLDDVTKWGIEKQIKAQVAQDPELVYVFLHDVEYILATGRNWKGPMGKFTLRIKKQAPDQIVSLCFPGKPKKVSPTVYEFVEKDFVPPDKLVVYFYDVTATP